MEQLKEMPSVLKQQVCIASFKVLGPVVFMLAVTTNNQKCYQTETSNLIKRGLKHEVLWHFFINNSPLFIHRRLPLGVLDK